MTLSEIEKYQRKLKRLIEKCPDGYQVCYDSGNCEIYVKDSGAEFFDTEHSCGSAIYAGGGCPMNASSGVTNTDTGNDRDMIIGDGIFVDMQAKQN